MKLFRKILRIVLVIAAILSIIYIIMHFTDILSILPLDKLKAFFGGMFDFVVHSFKNIIAWIKSILGI